MGREWQDAERASGQLLVDAWGAAMVLGWGAGRWARRAFAQVCHDSTRGRWHSCDAFGNTAVSMEVVSFVQLRLRGRGRAFVEEAGRCEHQCFFGELARLHWKRYPSIPALLSDAALADIDSMALLLTDSAALLERQHAGVRRSGRSREETHLEHVMDSSAARLVAEAIEAGKGLVQ